VVRILTANQKQQHVNVCEELHEIASDNAASLSRVNTGDASWICGYNPETKQQFSQMEESKFTETEKGETGE
jgi:hypothetical protein